MMRNPRWAPLFITGVSLAVTLAVTACGKGSPAGGAYGAPVSSTPATSSASPGPAQAGTGQTGPLKTETTSAGMVLASSNGLTLYYYTGDKPGSGTSACTGSCASAWPPLTAPVKAPAGVRLPGPLGMITRPGGVKQVTLNGYPIYFYSGDKAPGQDTGNGIEGAWHVIKIPAATTTAKMLRVVRTSAGTVLAGSHGYTLYYYAEDKPGSGKSVCTGSCARAWPALAGPVRAPAGVRLTGPLGTITRPSGFRQATLDGYPLYTYSGDKAPGQATGNGIGGAWHVIKVSVG
jgi:predicted lipoprotein with Yx(FWY)xxD motif